MKSEDRTLHPFNKKQTQVAICIVSIHQKLMNMRIPVGLFNVNFSVSLYDHLQQFTRAITLVYNSIGF